MLRRAETDRWLFVATITLCLAGAVMVFSASALTAREQYGNSYHFLLRQLLWLGLGLVAMFAMINLDYRRLRRAKLVLTYFFVVLIMLVGVFFLDKSHGWDRSACSLRNWLSLLSFSIWPGFWNFVAARAVLA